MSDDTVSMDPVQQRITQLGFKKATRGLSSEEQQELDRLIRQAALNRATNGG